MSHNYWWEKEVCELWPPTCMLQFGEDDELKLRHWNDRAALRPYCRFGFDNTSVAVRILWCSSHFLFIALCVSGLKVRLVFLSWQERLAIVSTTAAFLERCIFLCTSLEVCHRAQELHWAAVGGQRSLLEISNWGSLVSRINNLASLSVVQFALLLLRHCSCA